ncbi:unnamed protein product, partial [Tetraodon nigroviridis]
MNSSGPAYPLASLYVGDLHPDVTEAMLYQKFSPAGPIMSIRVCRDIITRRSLGYAYINFQQPADGSEEVGRGKHFYQEHGRVHRQQGAVRHLLRIREHSVLQGKGQRCQGLCRDAGGDVTGRTALFQVVCDERGSKGYGFVHFETEEAANRAIETMNGMLLNDRKVFVGNFKSRKEREEELGSKALKFTNVYIKNFGEDYTDEKLKEVFSAFGRTLSVRVMKDERGRSRGFGFVNFAHHGDAQKAVDEMNGTELNGKVIYVGRAQKRLERQGELKRKFELIKQDRIQRYQGVNLYVKNLDDGIDDERLRKEFAPYGTITSAKVMTDGPQSRGFGFVCFSSPEEATKAVTEMNGRIVATKPLYVALAQRREERKAILTNKYMQRLATLRTMSSPVIDSYQQAGYYMTVPQPPTRSFYSPNAVSAMRALPRWTGQPHRLQGPYTIVSGPRRGSTPIASVRQASTQAPNIISSAQKTNNIGTQTVGGRADIPGIPRSGQYKYSSAVRNAQHVIAVHAPPTRPQPSVHIQGQEPLTASMLAAAPLMDQKQLLGERLYPLISALHPNLAGKITGMLLEIDNSELLHMLETPESLHSKVSSRSSTLPTQSPFLIVPGFVEIQFSIVFFQVDEAIAVLQAHRVKECSKD